MRCGAEARQAATAFTAAAISEVGGAVIRDPEWGKWGGPTMEGRERGGANESHRPPSICDQQLSGPIRVPGVCRVARLHFLDREVPEQVPDLGAVVQ